MRRLLLLLLAPLLLLVAAAGPALAHAALLATDPEDGTVLQTGADVGDAAVQRVASARRWARCG